MANEETFLAYTIHKKGEKMMKRIKKLAIIMLTIIISMFSAGCSLFRDPFQQYKFFTKEDLERFWVPDLPQLPYGKNTRYEDLYMNLSFYCTLTEDDFFEYAESVYNYLKDNFKYVGYGDGEASTYTFISASMWQQCLEEKEGEAGKTFVVEFIYGNELYTPTAGCDLLNWMGIRIIQTEQPRKIDKYKDFSYSTRVHLMWNVMNYQIID